MKKLFFTAYNLNIGGIEKALIALLKSIDYSKYEVTLLLEKKEGILIDSIPNKIKIIEYKVNNNKNIIIRKIVNRLNVIFFILKNYMKYDSAICYAPYSIPGSIIARYMSKNNSIWIHSDYYYLYDKNINKIKTFFDERKISKFNHIIFVADEAKNNFNNIYSNLKYKTVVCNNLIDIDFINESSLEIVNEIKPSRKLFINISRHEEHAKKITRLIEAAKMLKEANYDFEVWLIGSGESTNLYEEKISEYDLSDNIKLLGMKKNPYPYYKLADAFILTSDYEGFPVVYLESIMFNVPIITTIDVTGSNLTINNNYGLIADKSAIDVFNKMKEFIDKGYSFSNRFDPYEYNQKLLNEINNIFNNKW